MIVNNYANLGHVKEMVERTKELKHHVLDAPANRDMQAVCENEVY
jgi:hypothetical protein